MSSKRTTNREFAEALANHPSRPARQQPSQAVMKVGADMRLTTDDLARLNPEQVQAVFEGVGRLAALGLGRP